MGCNKSQIRCLRDHSVIAVSRVRIDSPSGISYAPRSMLKRQYSISFGQSNPQEPALASVTCSHHLGF